MTEFILHTGTSVSGDIVKQPCILDWYSSSTVNYCSNMFHTNYAGVSLLLYVNWNIMRVGDKMITMPEYIIVLVSGDTILFKQSGGTLKILEENIIRIIDNIRGQIEQTTGKKKK
jgi:hypothetical protein